MPDENVPDEVAFDYIKSSQYRVIHADGFWGGITPRLKIFMTVWNERPPIPKRSFFSVDDSGNVGPEIREKRECLDSMAVREVEAGVMLDLGLAKSLHKWLEAKIAETEKLIEQGNQDQDQEQEQENDAD